MSGLLSLWWVSSSVPVVTTYHRLGDFNNKHLFLPVLEAKIKFQIDLVCDKHCLSDLHTAFSCILTCKEGRKRKEKKQMLFLSLSDSLSAILGFELMALWLPSRSSMSPALGVSSYKTLIPSGDFNLMT